MFDASHRVLVQCEWDADALHQLVHVLSLLQEPCLRQEALRFSFTIVQRIISNTSPPVRSTKLSSPREASTQLYEKCSELMLLGVTDVWSAIRKESARQTATLVLHFLSMDAIDGFIERLLRIAVGSEHVRQETLIQTRWGEQDGALYALSLLLSSIRVEKRALDEKLHPSQTNDKANSSAMTSRVASDIRGGFAAAVGFAPATHFSFGSRHPSVPRLPRSLVQSLKSVLYQCLRHEQLSVREHAAQCLKHYVDLCEEPMQLLLFQEAMSKLNRMKMSSGSSVTSDDAVKSTSDGDHELLEAFEAEGLLDVLAKLAPSLPSAFLLKHWKFVFPTLERYIMHTASSVRQKSSAVVLSLAKLSQSGSASQAASSSSVSSHEAALELLVEMMLGLSASQDHDLPNGGATILCWQQREGRMLSIEALVDLLGKDLLFRKFGTRLLNGSADELKKRSQAPVVKTKDELIWASSSASLATWTLDEDELADLTAVTRRSKQADASEKTESASQTLVSSLSAFLAEKVTRGGKTLGATEFWHRVLKGWLQQTQIAFASNQFELRRISRQVLPKLLRLSLWTNQLELLELQGTIALADTGECWRWPCLKFVLLHIQFLRESAPMNSAVGDDKELIGVLPTGLQSAWSLQSVLTNGILHDYSTSGADSYDTESTIVRVEAQLMTFLSFSRFEDKEVSSLGLLESGLATVHANLPLSMQLPQYITPDRPSVDDTSSLDRQLSISLVRLLPSIARALGVVIAKHNSEENAADREETVSKCWLILERSVLTWLATDDMFRWITVDQSEAQLSLLKTLDTLLQRVPVRTNEHFDSLDMELELILKQLKRIDLLAAGKNQQHRLKESTLTYALNICLSMWKNSTRGDCGGSTINTRCCQGIVQVYAQLTALTDNFSSSHQTKSSTSQSEVSSWDDWDGDEDEPGELGNNKTSQLRATAAADERDCGGVPDQVFSNAVSEWSSDQLSALHASISASAADACALLLALVDRLGTS